MLRPIFSSCLQNQDLAMPSYVLSRVKELLKQLGVCCFVLNLFLFQAMWLQVVYAVQMK